MAAAQGYPAGGWALGDGPKGPWLNHIKTWDLIWLWVKIRPQTNRRFESLVPPRVPHFGFLGTPFLTHTQLVAKRVGRPIVSMFVPSAYCHPWHPTMARVTRLDQGADDQERLLDEATAVAGRLRPPRFVFLFFSRGKKAASGWLKNQCLRVLLALWHIMCMCVYLSGYLSNYCSFIFSNLDKSNQIKSIYIIYQSTLFKSNHFISPHLISSIYPSILCICILSNLSILSIYMSVCMSVCFYIYLSVCLSIYLSIYLSICLPT